MDLAKDIVVLTNRLNNIPAKTVKLLTVRCAFKKQAYVISFTQALEVMERVVVNHVQIQIVLIVKLMQPLVHGVVKVL